MYKNNLPLWKGVIGGFRNRKQQQGASDILLRRQTWASAPGRGNRLQKGKVQSQRNVLVGAVIVKKDFISHAAAAVISLGPPRGAKRKLRCGTTPAGFSIRQRSAPLEVNGLLHTFPVGEEFLPCCSESLFSKNVYHE